MMDHRITGIVNKAFNIDESDLANKIQYYNNIDKYKNENNAAYDLGNEECHDEENNDLEGKSEGKTEEDNRDHANSKNDTSYLKGDDDGDDVGVEEVGDNGNDIKSVKGSDKSDFNDEKFGEVKKFSGVFLSLREKSVKKVWRRCSLGKYDLEKSRDRQPELTRSQYSLVSNGDLTAGALQLWLGLPEEVKYDPALAAFRQFYEKESERARQESVPLQARKTSVPRIKRLPAVSSAPHLNNNTERQNGVSDNPQNGSVYFSQESKGLSEEAPEINHDQFLHGQRDPTAWDKARTYTKLSLLVGCWVFFTVIFFMFNEKETIVRNCVLIPGQTKDYILDIPKNHLNLLVDISGPFLSGQDEKNMNLTDKNLGSIVDVWIERWVVNGVSKDVNESEVIKREKTKPQSFQLLDSDELQFSEAQPRSALFEHQSDLNTTAVYVIRMATNASVAVPLSISYQEDPIDVTTGVIYACLLLVLLYGLIIFEIINRTLAAIVVSTLSLAVLSIAGERPSVEEVISWLDVETLLLLLSMMLLVAIMAETGMFDFLAVYTFQVTKGKMWPLINVLCVITAVLSTFLDNVTTVLLITPVTIKLCEVMELHPIPVLTAMVLYSNIGGTATPVGDPPNVIIASNQIVIQSGINFANFTLHMTIGILLVGVQTYCQLRFMYRDVTKLRPSEPREIQDLRRQLNVWRRAADSLPHMSKDELVVKERLERKVVKINSQLAVALKERNKRVPKETFQRTLSELKEKYKIRDKKLLIKSCVAIGFVVTMFFLHAFPEFSRVSLGWTALLGAILLLILADREDIESILHRVEWSTLLFFAALFVLMEALTKLGLIDYIGGLTEDLILKVDEGRRLAVALLLLLWVSGITSAFVDNIPLTTMMVRVVTSLGTNPALGLPLPPLIWALSFGACLGGNGTLIGASANVVCAGVAEQHGYKITFVEFFKVGFPIMIGHLVVASGYLMLCHCLMTWH